MEENTAGNVYSLGSEVKPILYELFLHPDTTARVLHGHIKIHLLAVEDFPGDGMTIKLHSLGINITEFKVYTATEADCELPSADTPAGANFKDLSGPQGSQDISGSTFSTMAETEMVGFTTSMPIKKGQRLQLQVKYTGRIVQMGTKTPSGLHLYDSATDPHALTTHLEPTNARCLYPCFDEPGFKTRMQVTFCFLSDYTVVGNTMMENRQVGRSGVSGDSDAVRESVRPPDGTNAPDGMQVIRFEVTPLIPSYLVSVATGRMQCLATETKRGIITRVFFPESHDSSDGWFVLDLLTKAVDFYEEYFSFELPLRKLDIVGLSDFNVLGMENWGMLCFHGDYMLVSASTPIERRQRIARLVAHEVAHQWFGNVVSLKTWRYIWLKEGFCRYLEYFFVNHWFPRWQIWGDFLTNVFNVALQRDTAPNFHPIEVDVAHPRRVFDYFDTISYGKAAGVLRMMATLVGENTLSAAMRKLITDHAFKCIDTEDFLEVVRSCIPPIALRGVDVPAIIKRWVTVSGHPYVFVERDSSRSGLRVSQFVLSSYTVGALERLVNTHQRTTSTQLGLVQQTHRQHHRRHSRKSVDSASPNLAESASGQHTPPSQRFHFLGQSPGNSAPQVFACHPSALMECSTMPIPLRVMMVEQGKTSTTELIVLREAVEVLANRTEFVFFNPGATAVVRVDYDTELWEMIFGIAPYLQALDRLNITITLFELRAFHVGSTAAAAPLGAGAATHAKTSSDGSHESELSLSLASEGSRSSSSERSLLLLKWIRELCIVQCEKNSAVWKAVTDGLWRLAVTLQSQACSGAFRAFVISAYENLLITNALSFYSSENRTDFKASHNISDQGVTDALQLLSFCGSTQVLGEAEGYAERVMAYWFPSCVGVSAVSNTSIVGANASATNAAMLGGGGGGGGSTAGVSAGTAGGAAAGGPDDTRSPEKGIRVTDKVFAARARVALEGLVVNNHNEQGDLVWARCLTVVLYLLKQTRIGPSAITALFAGANSDADTDADRQEMLLTPAEVGELCVDDISIQPHPEVLDAADTTERQAWLQLLLPVVVAHRHPCTHQMTLNLVRSLAFIPAETLQAIARNTPFLKVLLGSMAEDLAQLSDTEKRTVRALLFYTSSTGCADATVLQLLQQRLPSTEENVLRWMESVEMDVVWAEYVTPFYTSFLTNSHRQMRQLVSESAIQADDGPVSI